MHKCFCIIFEYFTQKLQILRTKRTQKKKIISTMVGQGRKNTTKPKETLEKNKINQLEKTKKAKI